MASNRAPAFQFYPDKWQSHVRRLGDSSYRVYHELLSWMWLQSPDYCSIEASAEAVACAVCMPIQKVKLALEEIQVVYAPLLKLEDGRYVSNGLRKERDKQSLRRETATVSANSRWKNANASKNYANASKNDANACEKDANASRHANASKKHANASKTDANACFSQCSSSSSPTPFPSPVLINAQRSADTPTKPLNSLDPEAIPYPEEGTVGREGGNSHG